MSKKSKFLKIAKNISDSAQWLLLEIFLLQVDAQPSVIACEPELPVPGHSSIAFSDPELQVVMRFPFMLLLSADADADAADADADAGVICY